MKTLKYTFLVWLFLVGGLLVSCSDNDEANYAPLHVTKVSTVLDREQGIEKADLAQYIIVHGTGLNAVNSIFVNDVPVDLKKVYFTADELTFSIPRVIPGKVNNLITLSSDATTLEIPMSVFVPDLRVDGMGNEFTPAGDMMAVVGDFFDLYEITTESGQLFFGDKEMKIEKAVQDTLYFKLPEDAAVGSKIKLVSPIAGEVIVPGKYKERGHMLCDFDPLVGWGGAQYVSGGPTPAPFSGQYCHFTIKKGELGENEWGGAIIQIGTSYTDDMKANPDNYMVKFEVNTIIPLAKRWILFCFSQIQYQWKPFNSGLAFNTDKKWSTVSFNLGELWKGEIPVDGIIQIMGNGTPEDTDICFDNFRIVPND